jgi:hypothetical protein
MIQTKILQKIEMLEEQLKQYEIEYQKYVELDQAAYCDWQVANSRGFYNGIITALSIQILDLHTLLNEIGKS